MRNLFRFVGLRHLTSKPGRTVLTTLGICLGVALFTAIQIINQSTLHSFKESIEAMAGATQLSVSAGEAGFGEDRLELIEKTEGVKRAVPMVETRAYIAGGDASTETLIVLGVDLLKEQGVRTYKTTEQEVIEDPLVFLNQPDSIIVTHAFAEKRGLKLEDKFEIATARGKRLMTVRGLLTPDGPAKAYGGQLAIMDIDGARMTFGKEDKIDRADLVLKDGANPDTVAGLLRERLGPGFQVETPTGQTDNRGRLVKSYQSMLSFFSTLALLVGLFMVTNSVSISVAERRKEIGTLRAVGTTRRGILVLFLSEAVMMGLIGSLAGVFLGRFLASGLIDMVSQSMSTQYMTRVQPSTLFFGSGDIVNGLILGMLAAVGAALWPSYKATAVHPLEAMKRNQASEENSHFGFPLYAGIFLMAYFTASSLGMWGFGVPIFDMINQASSMMGPALLGPALVAGLLLLFRGFFVRIGGTITRLAKDNLLRNPRRTGSNVISLMVGLTLVTIIASLNSSFKNSIASWYDRALKTDIMISSHGKISTYQVQPIHEEVGLEIAQVPGVAPGTRPGAYGFRFVHFQYEGKQLALKALDEPTIDQKYSMLDTNDITPLEAGQALFHSKDDTILISDNMSRRYSKKAGDRVSIQTPTGEKSFRVAGVLIDYASPEGVVYMSRDLYKKYWNDKLVSGFGVMVNPGFEVGEVRRSIDRKFGQARNLMTVSNAELRESIMGDIDDGFRYTKAIEAAALLVGLLGLFNTFLISVLERTRELGMLRAVGMSRGQMRWMILQEAVAQGGFGAIVAVALGSWIGYIWVTTTLSQVLGWIVHFSFPWAAVFTTVAIGIGVTLLAGIYPARRAARIEIRDALEFE
ncbi:MAG: FtsX-like permease family protein [Bdellovibrionia bacterium]